MSIAEKIVLDSIEAHTAAIAELRLARQAAEQREAQMSLMVGQLSSLVHSLSVSHSELKGYTEACLTSLRDLLQGVPATTLVK